MVEVPGLGITEPDQVDGWLRSKPTKVNVLGNIECEFILEDYENDENKGDFHDAIFKFLSLKRSSLEEAQDHIYKYYKDILRYLTPDGDWYVEIDDPAQVWEHIQLSRTPLVSRRPYGDGAVYISLDCSCDWEQEHGLQIVFKEGAFVNKIGPYYGHLTNADAYADDSFEDIVYKST